MISLESLQTPGEIYMPENRSVEKKLSLYVKHGKRVFDIVFSIIIILCILSWLLPIVGILIKLNSPGPVFFIQPRTGKRGKSFKCLKLRTMIHERQDEFQQTTKNDHRVTKLGKLLRKTNIDEMPQFINVLVGQMSIVGPRPHAIQHDAQFWNQFPEYRLRYNAKPGITGLAQVRGARGETEALIKMKHRVKYDLYYNKRQSLGFDIHICWWTIKGMIKGDVNAC